LFYRALADKHFGSDSGLSDDEIKKILDSKTISKGQIWDYKKKLTLQNQIEKRLKEKLNSLLLAKNIFQAKATEHELSLQGNLSHTSKRVLDLEKENEMLKKSLHEAQRQVSLKSEKIITLDIKLKSQIQKISDTEKAHTKASISLEDTKDNLNEYIWN